MKKLKSIFIASIVLLSAFSIIFVSVAEPVKGSLLPPSTPSAPATTPRSPGSTPTLTPTPISTPSVPAIISTPLAIEPTNDEGLLVWEKYTPLADSFTGTYFYDIAVDNSGVYFAGFDGSKNIKNSRGGYDKFDAQWHIEKRDLVSGSLYWTQIQNPSSLDDYAKAIAVDGTGVYVAGKSALEGSPYNYQWRIEKRDLISGDLIWQQTEGLDKSFANYADIEKIAIDGDTIYILGNGGGNPEWRLEKRRISDGALLWAVQGATPIKTLINARDLAVDSSGIYITEKQTNTQNWTYKSVIHKIEKNSGGIIWSRDINDNIAIAIDDSDIYLLGIKQLEKRSLTDNVLIWSQNFPTNMSGTRNSIVLDKSGGLYVAGFDIVDFGSGHVNQWRIEKRKTSDGALLWIQNPDYGKVFALTLDNFGGLYSVGSSFFPGQSSQEQMRIEKREAIDNASSLYISGVSQGIIPQGSLAVGATAINQGLNSIWQTEKPNFKNIIRDSIVSLEQKLEASGLKNVRIDHINVESPPQVSSMDGSSMTLLFPQSSWDMKFNADYNIEQRIPVFSKTCSSFLSWFGLESICKWVERIVNKVLDIGVEIGIKDIHAELTVRGVSDPLKNIYEVQFGQPKISKINVVVGAKVMGIRLDGLVSIIRGAISSWRGKDPINDPINSAISKVIQQNQGIKNIFKPLAFAMPPEMISSKVDVDYFNRVYVSGEKVVVNWRYPADLESKIALCKDRCTNLITPALTVRSFDGKLIRNLRFAKSVAWDLRNNDGNFVAPGTYEIIGDFNVKHQPPAPYKHYEFKASDSVIVRVTDKDSRKEAVDLDKLRRIFNAQISEYTWPIIRGGVKAEMEKYSKSLSDEIAKNFKRSLGGGNVAIESVNVSGINLPEPEFSLLDLSAIDISFPAKGKEAVNQKISFIISVVASYDFKNLPKGKLKISIPVAMRFSFRAALGSGNGTIASLKLTDIETEFSGQLSTSTFGTTFIESIINNEIQRILATQSLSPTAQIRGSIESKMADLTKEYLPLLSAKKTEDFENKLLKNTGTITAELLSPPSFPPAPELSSCRPLKNLKTCNISKMNKSNINACLATEAIGIFGKSVASMSDQMVKNIVLPRQTIEKSSFVSCAKDKTGASTTRMEVIPGDKKEVMDVISCEGVPKNIIGFPLPGDSMKLSGDFEYNIAPSEISGSTPKSAGVYYYDPFLIRLISIIKKEGEPIIQKLALNLNNTTASFDFYDNSMVCGLNEFAITEAIENDSEFEQNFTFVFNSNSAGTKIKAPYIWSQKIYAGKNEDGAHIRGGYNLTEKSFRGGDVDIDFSPLVVHIPMKLKKIKNQGQEGAGSIEFNSNGDVKVYSLNVKKISGFGQYLGFDIDAFIKNELNKKFFSGENSISKTIAKHTTEIFKKQLPYKYNLVSGSELMGGIKSWLNKNKNEISKKIKEWREGKNLSQEQFAELADVPLDLIAGLENIPATGQITIPSFTVDNLQDIVNALGSSSIGDLLQLLPLKYQPSQTTTIKLPQIINQKISIKEDSPFGMHPAHINDKYTEALDIGVKWHRPSTYIFWSKTQPDLNNSKLDFSFYDIYYGNVPADINILANIAPDNPRKSNNYLLSKSYLPKNEKKYLEFVKAAIERYDGDGKDDMPGLKNPIKYWQVGNEPDNKIMAGFAKLQKITYTAIKEACFDCQVVVGGAAQPVNPGSNFIGDKDDYFKYFSVMYEPILAELNGYGFDIFDFHWYGDINGDYIKIKPAYDGIKSKLKTYNFGDAKIWITEIGAYSGTPEDFTSYDYQSEKEQAADYLKRFIFPLSIGVKKIFPAFGLIEGFAGNDGYFDHTGFIYDGRGNNDSGRGAKKLSYYTYKKMTEILEGSDWGNIQTIQEKDGIYIYKFMKNGKQTWVAWNDNSENKQIAISGIILSKVKITEAVPKYEFGKNVMDYSTAFNTDIKTPSNGKISITLTDKPVFAEER